MKIAVVTPYGEAYSDDRLFDLNACTIGQNLLLPGIRLKEALEQLGHEYHTADMYPHAEEVDVWIFQDLNNSSPDDPFGKGLGKVPPETEMEYRLSVQDQQN